MEFSTFPYSSLSPYSETTFREECISYCKHQDHILHWIFFFAWQLGMALRVTKKGGFSCISAREQLPEKNMSWFRFMLHICAIHCVDIVPETFHKSTEVRRKVTTEKQFLDKNMSWVSQRLKHSHPLLTLYGIRTWQSLTYCVSKRGFAGSVFAN